MNKDILIVKIYFYVGVILGISLTLTKKCLIHQLYIGILFSLTIYGTVYSILSRVKGFWINSTLSQIVLECFEVFLELFLMLFCFTGAFKYATNWKMVFKNLKKIDSYSLVNIFCKIDKID